MNKSEILLTIVGIQRYKGRFPFSAGRQLVCAKEPENKFDKNAIRVLDVGNTKVGYIANNDTTVLEGTITANQVYDKIGDYCVIEVVRSTDYNVVCRVIEPDFQTEKLIKAFTTDRFDPDYPFTEEYPPEHAYPFDYCEFPFEYDLINIDLSDDTIPDRWRIYLISCELGIDEQQMDEIEEIANDMSDRDLFYFDPVDVLYELKYKQDRTTETIEKIILDDFECWEEPDEYSPDVREAISEAAARISDILTR